MKNLLSKIKTFAEDNPHFIFSLFAFTLTISALVFCFSLPSYAADEPSESEQVVIPAGTYSWNETIDVDTFFNQPLISFPFTLSADIEGSSITLGVQGLLFNLASGSRSMYYSVISGPSEVVGTELPINIPAYIYGNSDYNSNSLSIYPFTLTYDVSVDNVFAVWFFNNTTLISPPEPEPTPTYTIQPNYYQIKLQPDMIPDDVGFYEYGGQFIYEGETYRSLRFARVSSLLTNVYLYDDDGNQIVIKGQTASNDGWFSGRNITLVSPITTENEEAYTYFTENLSATEQSPFDLVTYMISGFFKALDNFYLFFDFTLLDFIFVMCGLLAAIWFLKLLAGG